MIKKIFLIVVGVILISPALLAQELKTYTNYEYGFSIDYPSDWEIKEAKDQHDATLSLISPPKDQSDRRDQVDFIFGDLRGRNLAHFIQEGSYKDRGSTTLLKIFSLLMLAPNTPSWNYKFIKNGRIRLADRRGFFVIYRDNDGLSKSNARYYKEFIFTIEETAKYGKINFSAPPKEFQRLVPQVDKIVNSLKIDATSIGLKSDLGGPIQHTPLSSSRDNPDGVRNGLEEAR